MRTVQFLSILSALGLLTACGGEINTVYVEPYKVACTGFVSQMCLVTHNETEDELTPEYDWIEGFNFEWGKAYVITTKTTELSDPPADGSSLRVELVEVLEAQPVTAPTTFSFTIRPEDYRMGYMAHVEQVSEGDNTQWRMLDQQAFSASEEVGQALGSALAGDAAANLEFEFQDDLSIVLISVTLL